MYMNHNIFLHVRCEAFAKDTHIKCSSNVRIHVWKNSFFFYHVCCHVIIYSFVSFSVAVLMYAAFVCLVREGCGRSNVCSEKLNKIYLPGDRFIVFNQIYCSVLQGHVCLNKIRVASLNFILIGIVRITLLLTNFTGQTQISKNNCTYGGLVWNLPKCRGQEMIL